MPDLDHVAVCALHQAIHHFNHVDPCSERGIHGGHFQADNAAADNQHTLRNLAQFQRAGAIYNTWIIRNKWQIHYSRAGSDNRLLELDSFLRAICSSDFDMMRADELTDTLHHVDLARLSHTGQASRHLFDHAFLVATQGIDVDSRRGESHAMLGHRRGLVNHGSYV